MPAYGTRFGFARLATSLLLLAGADGVLAGPPVDVLSVATTTGGGGGGGGAMGPIDLAFFSGLFACALWQRRRLASITARVRPNRTNA